MGRSLIFKQGFGSSYSIAQAWCLYLIACFVVMFWLVYMSS